MAMSRYAFLCTITQARCPQRSILERCALLSLRGDPSSGKGWETVPITPGCHGRPTYQPLPKVVVHVSKSGDSGGSLQLVQLQATSPLVPLHARRGNIIDPAPQFGLVPRLEEGISDRRASIPRCAGQPGIIIMGHPDHPRLDIM